MKSELPGLEAIQVTLHEWLGRQWHLLTAGCLSAAKRNHLLIGGSYKHQRCYIELKEPIQKVSAQFIYMAHLESRSQWWRQYECLPRSRRAGRVKEYCRKYWGIWPLCILYAYTNLLIWQFHRTMHPQRFGSIPHVNVRRKLWNPFAADKWLIFAWPVWRRTQSFSVKGIVQPL